MRHIVLSLALLLCACATPDLTPFQESTTAVSTVLKSSGETLTKDWTAIAATIKDTDERDQFLKSLATVQQTYKRVNKAQSVLDAYAKALGRVSNMGLEGKEAFDAIVADLRDIKSTIEGNPSATGSGDQADKAKQKNDTDDVALVGGLIQAIQGAASNAELYQIMEAAEPKLQAIVTKIKGFSASLKTTTEIAFSLANDYAPAGTEEAKKAYDALDIAIYQYREREAAAATLMVTPCANAVSTAADPFKPCTCTKTTTGNNGATQTTNQACTLADRLDQDKAAAATMTKVINDTVKARDTLLPQKLAYEAFEKANNDKEKAFLNRLSLLDVSASQWLQDHQTIITYLKACKGLSGIFDSQCKVFSSENLKLGATVLSRIGLLGL